MNLDQAEAKVVEVFGREHVLPPNPLLDMALTYADLGWEVFPTHNGPGCSCWRGDACQNQAKHPRTRNGVKDATTNMDQIELWWANFPQANIGIRMGSELLVLDFDGDEGSEILHAWSKPAVVVMDYDVADNGFETPRVVTGNGTHLYFRAPTQAKVRAQIGVMPGVDIRVGDSYVIAPPSVHASGKRYEWEVDHSPVIDMDLAEVPAVVMEVIAEAGSREKPRVPKRIRKGKRNDLYYRLACGFWAYNMPEQVIEMALIGLLPQTDQPKGDPFTEENVRDIVRRVTSQYPPGRSGERALEEWQEIRKQRESGGSA